ncbi:MAG: N-acetyltransferase [Propionicimonas sp.]|mgnify:FL=1
MSITLRRTRNSDHRATEELVRDSFWDLYRPGCVEHLVTHQLRAGTDVLVDLVAEQDGRLVGCLLATRARIIHPDGTESSMCSVGPIAVATGHQHRGIGTLMITEALNQTRAAGIRAAFLYGDPGYYSRFGFADAATWQVTTPDGGNFDAFMGLELVEGGLDGLSGRLLDSADFEVQPDQVEEFDAQFAPKTKHCREGQLFE